MKKFPKIRYPADRETDGIKDGEVVVLEKLDGANFRWTYDEDGSLRFGTRNVEYEGPDDENTPHAFKHAVEYVDETVDPIVEDMSNYVFFGEAMHEQSIDYDDIDWDVPHQGSPHVPLDSDDPNVVVFDVWDCVEEEWLDFEDVLDMVVRMGLRTPPVIERGDPNDLEFDIPDESMFGGEPEGIVIRRVDGEVRAKKVTDDFREKNAQAFEDPSAAESDAAEFVATYVTESRIEKMAHKLVDGGEFDGLTMEMMGDVLLPRRVIRDVFAEEGWEILKGDIDLDEETRDEIRSKTCDKCARVLQREVQRL